MEHTMTTTTTTLAAPSVLIQRERSITLVGAQKVITHSSPTAAYPFNDPTADAILISSDNVRFRIHKHVLSAASPVFRQRFRPTRPKSADGSQSSSRLSSPVTPMEGSLIFSVHVEEVQVSESSEVLEKLLRWCHPEGSHRVDSLEDIYTLANLGRMYEVNSIVESLRKMLLSSKALERDPVQIFTIACRAELWDVAGAAMKRSMVMGVDGVFASSVFATEDSKEDQDEQSTGRNEVGELPARAYKPLVDYHWACGRVARAVVDLFPWADANYCWFSSFGVSGGCTCEKVDTPDSWDFDQPETKALTARWFYGYARTLTAALYAKPNRETVVAEAEAARMLQGIECQGCKAKAAGDLSRFNEALSYLIELAISMVAIIPSEKGNGVSSV